MQFLEHFDFVNCIYILNKAEEDIRMSKHVLQIKVCCYLPYAEIQFSRNIKIKKFGNTVIPL